MDFIRVLEAISRKFKMSDQKCLLYPPGGFREFFFIAYPLVISHASVAVMHFVDRLFLSWVGSEEIAAVMPAGILFFTMLAFFLGVSEYANTFVAQYYGAKRNRSIGLVTWQGVVISIAGGLFSLLLLPLGNLCIDHSGHAPEVIVLEKTYFTYLYTGGTFFILNGALSSFYSGRGRTGVIMTVSILTNTVNGILDYGLIFGAWGFPCWGVRGAAIATVFSTALMSVIYFVLFLSTKNHQAYHTRSTIRIDFPLIKRMLRFGTPTGVQLLLDIGAFAAFIFLIGGLGKVELAASNIVLSLNMLSFFPMIGAEIAAMTLVGQYIGRKDYPTAEKCAYTAWFSVEGYMIFLGIIYFCFPEFLMELFRSESVSVDAPFEEIAMYGAKILWLVALYQISDAMILTFTGALRGAGDTAFAMWAAVICAWCFFVPGTWFILYFFQWGVTGAWLWAAVYLTLLGLVYLFRFRSGYWKTIQLIEDIPSEMS